MKTFSKISLLLVAFSALFLPACGGGGEGNQEYYVSVQNFKTGSQGFHFSSTPAAEIYADQIGIGGKTRPLSEAFSQLFGDSFSGGETATEGDPPPDDGVFTTGQFEIGGDSDKIEVGYYTSGGSSGQGFLYIGFQGEISDEVAHFMGAANPDDVKVTNGMGNDNFWVVDDDLKQLLIVTTNGATLKITLNFATGLAEVKLCVASATKAESTGGSGNNNPGSMNDGTDEITDTHEDAGEQIIAMRSMMFFAVSH